MLPHCFSLPSLHSLSSPPPLLSSLSTLLFLPFWLLSLDLCMRAQNKRNISAAMEYSNHILYSHLSFGAFSISVILWTHYAREELHFFSLPLLPFQLARTPPSRVVCFAISIHHHISSVSPSPISASKIHNSPGSKELVHVSSVDCARSLNVAEFAILFSCGHILHLPSP